MRLHDSGWRGGNDGLSVVVVTVAIVRVMMVVVMIIGVRVTMAMIVLVLVLVLVVSMSMSMMVVLRMGRMRCLDLDLRRTAAALRIVSMRLSVHMRWLFVSVSMRIVRMLHTGPPVIRRRSLIGRVMVMHIVLAV